MTSVATNLCGRWVKGRHVFRNPDYVEPWEGVLQGYSKKELKTLTTHQMTPWLRKDVEDRVVAVTCDGREEYTELLFWILIDGKPVRLYHPTIMPAEYVPNLR